MVLKIMEATVSIEPFLKLQNYHILAGPVYQRYHKDQANIKLNESNELAAIYHLIESHCPGFRFKNQIRHDKSILTPTDYPETVLLNNIKKFNCLSKEQLTCDIILKQLKEMPEEWTIVQLTSRLDPKERFEIDNVKYYTNSIYITVFNCGNNINEQKKGAGDFEDNLPFCVMTDIPRDKVVGDVIEFTKEMNAIIAENKSILSSGKLIRRFQSASDKQNYVQRRRILDDRLKQLMKDVQNIWLNQWRCLLTGKYVNHIIEAKMRNKIITYLTTTWAMTTVTSKTLNILCCLVKNLIHLKSTEVSNVLQFCFPEQKSLFFQKLGLFLKALETELSLSAEKKHPLILIVDDNLDCFPWEMIDVLSEQQVSRVPTFYFIFALFKQHEKSIENGYKIIENSNKSTYLLNPDSNLPEMDKRMKSFLDYWVPGYRSIVGRPPTEKEIKNIFQNDEIFCYMGHGCGLHLISTTIIQKLQLNAIVLLFGCSSSRMIKFGSQVELYGYHQLFLMSASPCVIGMLWDVTDLDTDELTSSFLSFLISPQKKQLHWKYVDKTKWRKGEKVEINNRDIQQRENIHEPYVLRALILGKACQTMSNYYLTKAACVARGIPVKIRT